MAVVVFCLLVWAIHEVASIGLPSAKLNSTSVDEIEDEDEFEKKAKFWIWVAVVEFAIEVILWTAICFVRSKVRNPERNLVSRITSEHSELEMVSQRENSADDAERPNAAEISHVSEPATDDGALSTAYDQNRVDTIRERIRRADEGINFLFWPWKPFP